MRNLFLRLKSEHKAKLHSIKSNYPNTYDDIVHQLKDKSFYTELTIATANSLCSHLGIAFTLSNFIDLFDEQ